LQEDIEIKEFEWYLRDHLFRQSNQGREQFKKESLAQEMTSLYLRYRNSTSQHINEMINAVVEKLISRQVLKKVENSLELTSRLSRLQCSKCYYISYLSSSNEPRNCLRCSFNELHDFPKKK
jgi:predicted transcriptional regulator